MDLILETAFQGIVVLALMTVVILLIGLYIRVRFKVKNTAKEERQEPKINSLESIENEIIVMKPLGGSSSSSSINLYWPLVFVVITVFTIGYFSLSNAEKKHEVDIALAAKTAQEQAKTQERKQREAFYEGMNQQIFNNQEQEAENARIAWQNYREAQRQQKINEILTMEQQSSNGAYIDARPPNQYNFQQAKINSYWKCTDDTNITTYSIEPCNIEAKQAKAQTQEIPSQKFTPTQKEIRIIENQRANIIHNPTPPAKVITKTVVVYRNVNNQPSLSKTNSLDCQNAKRAYKFENGSYFGKSFNRERIIKDVWLKCGAWPKDLDS